MWPAALAGVLAAGLGLGVAELVSGLLNRGITPVLAVGEVVIELSPTWLTEWAIDTFGTADKAVLIGGVVVVLTVLSAAIGVLAARHRGAGMLAAAALGVVAALAVRSRPDAVTYDLLPVVVGAGVAALALPALVNRAVEAEATDATAIEPASGGRADRRHSVLRTIAGTLGAAHRISRADPVAPTDRVSRTLRVTRTHRVSGTHGDHAAGTVRDAAPRANRDSDA